jgi:hypothetical protein
VCGVMSLALAGCAGQSGDSSAPSPSPSSSPSSSPGPTKTFTVSGFVTAEGSFGLACRGLGASADLHAGAPVVVRDAEGARLAAGVLGDGFADDDAPQRRCIFSFSVPKVPEGTGPFSVQVARRAPVPFDRRDAAQVTVRLP